MAMAQADPSLSPILHTPYPGVAHALAYLMARRAVERQLIGQGERYFNIPRRFTEICERASAYLTTHEEELLA
jgi:hypothetical protein